MKFDYFRYPWRVLFDDLAEENHAALPVASGACFKIGAAESLHTPLPFKYAEIDGNPFKIYEIPDTDQKGRVSELSYDGQQISAKIGAYGGFKAEEGEKASNLNVLIEESLRYIQRIEDIISSNTSKNASQLPSVPWELAIEELTSIDWQSEVVKKPLIVELAERQGHPLKEISRGAKRILRRRRDTERVSKAREFDKASLIRIAQLPGRTIPEKAGPRQRIPAVKRYETTDTLENRVVEHFCRLAEGEWRRTQEVARERIRGEWRTLSEGFIRLCRRVAISEDFQAVSKLKSPCIAPNYTLEQNMNYRSVWSGYKQLLQRMSEQEKCWAWSRRLFLNRAIVFAGELFERAFPTADADYLPYKKNLRSRLSQTHGLWLEAASFPGPRVVTCEKAQTTVYLLSPSDLEQGPKPLTVLASLNADGYFVSSAGSNVRVSPFYSFVGGQENGSLVQAYTDLDETYTRLRKRDQCFSTFGIRLQKPLFIYAGFNGNTNPLDSAGIHILHAGIPVKNTRWHSPSDFIVQGLRKEMLG